MTNTQSDISEEMLNNAPVPQATEEPAAPNDAEASQTSSVEGLEDEISEYASLDKEGLVKRLTEIIDLPVDEIKDRVESIKLNFYKKHKAEIEKARKAFVDAGGKVEEFVHGEDSLESTLKSLLKKYRESKSVASEKSEQEKQANLQAKLAIIEELKELTGKQESINETFQSFRNIQERWRAIGQIPQGRMADVWETYHHYMEVFYNYVKINKELRDIDLKKNFDIKEKLCKEAEALTEDPSIVKAFQKLQELHDRWRETGPVAAELKAELWDRFKAATSILNKKHQAYFESQKEEQVKNLELKTKLCEKAEELCKETPSTVQEWDQKSNALTDIQKEWRTIGFAPKKDNTSIYNRFRAVCDDFFAKKKEFYTQFKDIQNENLKLKQEICQKVEALKDSTEWKETTEILKSLQKQWKEIGPVPRKVSDAIWNRFRQACDTFFERKSQFFNDTHSEYTDNLNRKKALIAEILAFVPEGDNEKDQERLKDFQRTWSSIGYVPIKFKDSIMQEYRDAINAKFSSLRRTARRNEYANRNHEAGNDRERLLNHLKHLESEIVILENNIGFFSNSKNAESMINEVKQRIQAHRDEIAEIEDEIRKIDEADEN